jgi:Secretion system C-terminal sorting domain
VKKIFSLLLLLMLIYSFPGKGQSIPSINTAIGFQDLGDVSINVNNKDVALAPVTSLLNTPAPNCIPGSCNSLPVTLLSFEGRRPDVNTVTLKWKTTNELNNLGFDVERSLGNATQFTKVTFVPALANGGLIENYEMNDPNSFAGTSYYRLKQFDVDSQYTYSKIIAIDNTGPKESLTLYPNPARNILYLKIVSGSSGNGSVLLYDANGKMLTQQSSFIQKGSNLQQMDVNNLARGMYFIRLSTKGGTVLVESFSKQ